MESSRKGDIDSYGFYLSLPDAQDGALTDDAQAAWLTDRSRGLQTEWQWWVQSFREYRILVDAESEGPAAAGEASSSAAAAASAGATGIPELKYEMHLRWWRRLYAHGGVRWPPLRRLVWGFLSGALQCRPEQIRADRDWYEHFSECATTPQHNSNNNNNNLIRSPAGVGSSIATTGTLPNMNNSSNSLNTNGNTSDVASSSLEASGELQPPQQQQQQKQRALTDAQEAIERDLHRTYPLHVLFDNSTNACPETSVVRNPDATTALGQRQLRHLLYAYSELDPAVGYCQGMAMVGGVLLFNLPEAEAFAVFRHMLMGSQLAVRELYIPSFSRLQQLQRELDTLIQKHLPDLHSRFTAEDIGVHLFASTWFLTLYAAVFPMQLVARIWDFFLLRGWQIILSCALCILQWEQRHLAALDMEGVLLRLKRFNVPLDAVDTFMDCVLQAPCS